MCDTPEVELMSKPVVRKRVPLVHLQMIRDRNMLIGMRRFTTPDGAADSVKELFKYADRELLVVMGVDSKQVPTYIEIAAIGGVSACVVDMRIIFRTAILSASTNIILFHNHPSGDPTPSNDDISITKRVRDAGQLLDIKLLDHIILGSTHYSMHEHGLI